MKKNVLKKITITILILVIVASLFVGLSACNTDTDWNEVQANMNEVKSMTNKISMTDKGINVYDYSKSVKIEGANASISIIEKKLSDGFQYETDEKNRKVENVDKKSLLPLNLSSNVIATFEKSKEDGAIVYGANLEGVFLQQIMTTEEEFSINDTATLKIKCKDNKIREITLDYVTESGRVVSAIYSYEY